MSGLNPSQSISAVVTTFQSNGVIGGALDSVFAQTARPREVLVCDDGSTDDTLEQATRYDVEVLALAHSGIVGASRNRGVQHASGEWVAFLDADDRWEPRHLELFLDVLASDAAPSFDLFGGNGVRVREDGSEEPFFAPAARHPRGPVSVADFLRIRPVITSSAIARRDAIRGAGGFPEDNASVSAEDFDLWYRLLRRGGLFYDDRAHVRYNETPGGLTKGEGGWRSRAAAIHVLQRLLEQEKSAAERSLLQQALVSDRLVLAMAAARHGRLRKAASATGAAVAVGPRPFSSVVAGALVRRARRLTHRAR
jgi:glycosyltransferase involved in cell wall biosynthesis